MLLDAMFKNKELSNLRYAKFLDNTYPLFSQFGRNIYSSDVVQMCIDCKATELSKLQPKHIRREKQDKIDPMSSSSINVLFRCAPNELMTTKDFIEKISWQLEMEYNSFIFPAYELGPKTNGYATKRYIGFYPLSPTQVDFLQDPTGRLFVKMHFPNGKNTTLLYSEVIHLRKKYSLNDAMGGGANGQPDNTALLKTLEINNTILQGVGKAVKTSMQVRGILKINTVMEDDKLKAERLALEKQIADDAYGIVSGDYKGDFTPINIDPKVVDKETLDFVENKILRWYGVSIPILNGTATDEEYQAFYNRSLEPVIIGMNQAFTSKLFTRAEQSRGNEIIFYNFALDSMSVKNKIEIIKGAGDRGALTNNFILSMFGLEPYEGGDKRVASLNYINATIWDDYQIARAGIDSQTLNAGNKNGGENDGED